MTLLSSSSTAVAEYPIGIEVHQTEPANRPLLMPSVGEGAHDVSQEDADRESRIAYHRQEMEAAMRDYEQSGCFSDRRRADYHRIQFEREIEHRSPEQRARMAAEQNARMAGEPGATAQ